MVKRNRPAASGNHFKLHEYLQVSWMISTCPRGTFYHIRTAMCTLSFFLVDLSQLQALPGGMICRVY